jgi:hypothetical protein
MKDPNQDSDLYPDPKQSDKSEPETDPDLKKIIPDPQHGSITEFLAFFRVYCVSKKVFILTFKMDIRNPDPFQMILV